MNGKQGIKLCFVYMLRDNSNRVPFDKVYLRERVQTKRYFASKTTQHISCILHSKTVKNWTQRTIRHFNMNLCCSI